MALGLASQAPDAVLGSPLDLSFAIRLDAGETLEPACVRARVQVGERLLPAESLRTSLSGAGPGTAVGPTTVTFRVRSLVRIQEPVVELVLDAGCPSTLTRRFVIFADPPVLAPPGPAEAAAPPGVAAPVPAAAPAPAPVAAPAPGLAPVAAGAAAAPSAVATATPESAAPASRAVAAPPRAAAAAREPVPPRPARPARTASTDARPAASPAAAPRARAPSRDATRAAEPRPRLRLDPAPAIAAQPAADLPPVPEPGGMVLSLATLALVDQANEAVKVAIIEMRNAQARVAALEAQVAALNARVAEERALAARAQAEAAQRRRWLAPLALAFVALLGLAAWLGWRLRAMHRERSQDWHAAVRGATPAPASAPTPQSMVEPAPGSAAAPAAALTPATPATPATRTVRGAGLAPAHRPTASEWAELDPPGAPATPMPQGGWRQTEQVVGPAATPRHAGPDVSTEELIDLEQQAEFFIVLGQDEAAIDLLMAHVRDSGGVSPLPYLKLLDIYRRLGREDDYRRTQDRFNRRFNAHAPAWEAREQTGRGLDGYPAVTAELERVWQRPLDAMAELEALLFRRGGAAVFDLEAYRDLLLLYGLARENRESEQPAAGGSRPVDVLLPLDMPMDSVFEPSGMGDAGPAVRPGGGGPAGSTRR